MRLFSGPTRIPLRASVIRVQCAPRGYNEQPTADSRASESQRGALSLAAESRYSIGQKIHRPGVYQFLNSRSPKDAGGQRALVNADVLICWE